MKKIILSPVHLLDLQYLFSLIIAQFLLAFAEFGFSVAASKGFHDEGLEPSILVKGDSSLWHG